MWLKPRVLSPWICSPVCVKFYRLIHLYPHLPWLHCLFVCLFLYKYCLCECVLVAAEFQIQKPPASSTKFDPKTLPVPPYTGMVSCLYICCLFRSCFCPLFISASSSGPVFVPWLFLFWSCFCPLSISASSSGPFFVPCRFLISLPVLFLSLVYSWFLFRSCFCPLSIPAFSSGPVSVPCLFLLPLLVLFLSLLFFLWQFGSHD